MTAPAFVRKRPIYAPGPQVALDFLFEKRRTRKRGFVAMTIAELGQALGGKSPATTRRYLAFLTTQGEVLRAYNGGQGRRRACVFYVGKAAVSRALEKFPLWDAIKPKAGGKKAFPGLAMGRRVLEQRTRKDLKNEILNPSASVESRGVTASQLPPLGDQPRAVDVVADSRRFPPGPPSGGAASTETAPPATSTPAAPTLALVNGSAPTAQQRSKPSEPPIPPRGEKKAAQKGVRSEPAWLAIERRTLVCQSWGHWRKRYRKAHGRDYSEHPGDGKVMQRLVARALVKTGQSYALALEQLRWWFRQYMADPCPPGSPLGERHHPIFRLERITEEYGSPRPASVERVADGELERVTLADANTQTRILRPKPNDPWGATKDGHVEGASFKGDGQMVDNHRIVRVRRHGVGQGNELVEARKLLAWLEAQAASHPMKRVQLERQRAYVRRLELEQETKKP